MRKNFGAKPCMYPMPVLIIAAYDEKGTANAMNAAWGGISNNNEISMCLSAGHKTVKDILVKKEFTVSMGDAAHVTECDYLGMESGNTVADKMKKSGLTTEKAEFVDAPVIIELPICLECKMKSYDEKTGLMKGEIVNISADEKVLTEDKIDLAKAGILTFDPFNNAYHVIGEKAGNAFSEGAKLK